MLPRAEGAGLKNHDLWWMANPERRELDVRSNLTPSISGEEAQVSPGPERGEAYSKSHRLIPINTELESGFQLLVHSQLTQWNNFLKVHFVISNVFTWFKKDTRGNNPVNFTKFPSLGALTAMNLLYSLIVILYEYIRVCSHHMSLFLHKWLHSVNAIC